MAPQVPVSEYGSGFWRSVIWWQSTGFASWLDPVGEFHKADSQPGRVRRTSFLGDDDIAKQRGKRKKDGAKADATEGLPPLNLHAAGIDVGSAEHYVAYRRTGMQNRCESSAVSQSISIGWRAG
jgi:hypothetical protein